MRYLVSLVCVLALGVMPMVGCSDEETTGGTGGVGGVGGDGGNGGVGGACILGGNGSTCATADFDGACVDGVCLPVDCSELDEVVCVADIGPIVDIVLGFCILGECEPAVEDCSGAEDQTLCDAASGAPGLCFEQLCYMNPAGCETAEPGDPCWAPPIGDGPPGPSVCVISDEGSIVCAL